MQFSRPLFLAAAIASGALASAQSGELGVDRQDGRTSLALGTQTPFHETEALVTDARLIDIPGPALAVVWNEVDHLDVSTPWYAISQNGSTMASVRATSYEIGFEHARFEPHASLPDFGAAGLTWDGEVHLVQFQTQVLEEYREALEGLGATIYDHLVNHTLIVRMSPFVRERVEQFDFVRWIGPFEPALRLEPGMLANLIEGAPLEPRAYNVMVFERGPEQKELVVGTILQLGGVVNEIYPDGFRLVAELTVDQVMTLAGLPEVAVIDPWGAPEVDLNIVRDFSGADPLEAATGFTGQGVRGEVMDTGCFVGHQDFQHDGGVLIHTGNGGSTSHGTQVTGVVFGDGTGNANWRGILPNGKIVFAAYTVLGNRYTHTAALINPNLAYKCVFQTNSWGSPQTSSYNSISVEMDDILYINDIVIGQSQSNTGSTASRPQAWAKNIVAVGGVCHQNTLSKNDDSWCGASTGPASDGRIKPDLAHFYDAVTTPSASGGYSGFSGTSLATPCTIGHFGLFFQMWHNNIWNNGSTGATVFDSRPEAATARAAAINTADQWNFSGLFHNLRRVRQGWGAINVKKMYDTRNETIYVNGDDPVDNLATNSYSAIVGAGALELKATLVYKDPKGVAFSGTHRINDLDLVLTSPGGVQYFGNSGLDANMWSTAFGSASSVDTIENVFVSLPQAGTWTVEVVGADVNTDTDPSTAGVNAKYSLWITGATGSACPPPTNYCTAKLTSILTVPQIGSQGSPSTVTNDFSVTLDQALPNSISVCFSGTLTNNTPFNGGVLCVGGTVTRECTLFSSPTGSASCDIPVTGAMVGTTLNYQWWFRDPNASFGIGLSNGLTATFCSI